MPTNKPMPSEYRPKQKTESEQIRSEKKDVRNLPKTRMKKLTKAGSEFHMPESRIMADKIRSVQGGGGSKKGGTSVKYKEPVYAGQPRAKRREVR